jgi:LuxR family transcriptional regulator, maltose regulon positive regulatory protein
MARRGQSEVMPSHSGGLVERAAVAALRNCREAALLSWLKALPEELLRDPPVLSDIYAGASLSNRQFNGVDARLRDAEQAPNSPRMVVADEQGFGRLPGTIGTPRRPRAGQGWSGRGAAAGASGPRPHRRG